MQKLFILSLVFTSSLAYGLNYDHLATTELPPKENSELAADLFLYQMAIKDKQLKAAGEGGLFGDNICVLHTPASDDPNNNNAQQNFKIVTSNGVFESGKANVDKNSEDFKRLKRITSLMNNYFNKIGSTPKIKTVGYTDGEHINSSLGNERANRNLGTQRARNISSALGLNSDTASKVSSNMYDLPPEKRACDRRRVTTIEFEAVPLIKQGTEGSYTPSFKMIKDHKLVKRYAVFSAFTKLGENGFDINEVISKMPPECNNESTKKVLRHAQTSVVLRSGRRSRSNVNKLFKQKLDRMYPNPSSKDSAVLQLLRSKLSKGRIDSFYMRDFIKQINKGKSAKKNMKAFAEIISALKKREMEVGGTQVIDVLKIPERGNTPFAINQSNHAYDCFDVKDYYRKYNPPEVNDISERVKNGKLTIAFTEEDFKGHGNHLHCRMCKSGMRLDKSGNVVKHVRTSKEFTDKVRTQNYSPIEDSHANKTIALSETDDFNNFASHKAMKVVIVKNCEDPTKVDVFSSEHKILTINKLPFKETIDVGKDSKVCAIPMPVINTCTVAPESEMKIKAKPDKHIVHYYQLDGQEELVTLTSDNLNIVGLLSSITEQGDMSCSGTPKDIQNANDLIESVKCRNPKEVGIDQSKRKNILVPHESDSAKPGECPESFSKVATQN